MRCQLSQTGFDTAVPTCRVLVGGAGPVGKSVLEGADLAVRGAGLAVGKLVDDVVALVLALSLQAL